MTRKTLFLFLLFTLSLQSWAQQVAKLNVRGTVYERESLDPMPGATVRLLDKEGKVISGCITLKNGQYLLQNIPTGTYTVNISFMGFEPQIFTLKLPNKNGNYKAADVTLKENVIQMSETVITAQAAEMTVVEDTVVYNADAFSVPEGSVVEELIKKLPGVDIDENGKLTVNGKVIPRILVDGKEFFGKDPEVVLKNLPANAVDKIKVYDKKSDMTRITGIDDGEEEPVIDLTIKKGMKKGWMGNLNLSYGTHNRYSEKIMANHFVDKQQFSIVGNANNVNDNNFPGGGGFRRNNGSRSGQTARKMIGTNFALETNKIETGGSMQINFSNTDNQSWTNSQSFENKKAAYSNRHTLSKSNAVGFSFDYRLEWKPDSLTNILLRPNISYNQNNSRSKNRSASFNDDPYALEGVIDPLEQLELLKDTIGVNSNLSANKNFSQSFSGDASLQINRRLSKPGRNITLSVGGGWGNNEGESQSYSQIDYYQILATNGEDSVYHKIQYSNSPTKNYNANARFSYSEPIFTDLFLQFSYNFRFRYQNSDRNVSSLFDPLIGDLEANSNNFGSWTEYATQDTAQCKYVENLYYNQDIRLQIRANRTKYQFTAGINVQPQSSRTRYNKGFKDYNIERSVVNAAPTIDFRYRFSKQEQLRFSYRGNTGQPNITDLIPDTLENANPLNIRLGNAELKPSFTHNINANYNKSIRELQRNYSANIEFRTTQNSVSSRTEYNEVTGGRVTRPENINGNWYALGGFNFNTALTDTRFRLNTNTTARYTNAVSYVYRNKEQQTIKNRTGNMDITESMRGSFKHDWFELSLNGSIRYTHSRSSTSAASNLDTYHFNYGLSSNIKMPWNMTLSTDISENSRRGFSDKNMNTNELIWNLQIAQQFLKKKAATASLQFYDLLNQRSNVSRNISTTSRRDIRYNSINSYCMLHFIYRLNIFGARNQRIKNENRREKSNGRENGRANRSL